MLPSCPGSAAPRPASRRSEAGSAYLAVLLVLVVLTIFGLTLSLITQTEMQVGSNERTLSRVFYGADAGLEVATAKALIARDFGEFEFTYTDKGVELTSTAGLQLGSQVEVSAFVPIQTVPCNLCEINGAGEYGRKSYYRVNHAVSATARRFATLDVNGERAPLAEKSLSAMVEVQPLDATTDDSKVITKTDALKEIKF